MLLMSAHGREELRLVDRQEQPPGCNIQLSAPSVVNLAEASASLGPVDSSGIAADRYLQSIRKLVCGQVLGAASCVASAGFGISFATSWLANDVDPLLIAGGLVGSGFIWIGKLVSSGSIDVRSGGAGKGLEQPLDSWQTAADAVCESARCDRVTVLVDHIDPDSASVTKYEGVGHDDQPLLSVVRVGQLFAERYAQFKKFVLGHEIAHTLEAVPEGGHIFEGFRSLTLGLGLTAAGSAMLAGEPLWSAAFFAAAVLTYKAAGFCMNVYSRAGELKMDLKGAFWSEDPRAAMRFFELLDSEVLPPRREWRNRLSWLYSHPGGEIRRQWIARAFGQGEGLEKGAAASGGSESSLAVLLLERTYYVYLARMRSLAELFYRPRK